MAGVTWKINTKYRKFVSVYLIKWSMVPKHWFFLDFWLVRKTWFVVITFDKRKGCFSVPSGIWLFCFSAKRYFSEIVLSILVKNDFGYLTWDQKKVVYLRSGLARPDVLQSGGYDKRKKTTIVLYFWPVFEFNKGKERDSIEREAFQKFQKKIKDEK